MKCWLGLMDSNHLVKPSNANFKSFEFEILHNKSEFSLCCCFSFLCCSSCCCTVCGGGTDDVTRTEVNSGAGGGDGCLTGAGVGLTIVGTGAGVCFGCSAGAGAVLSSVFRSFGVKAYLFYKNNNLYA